jgi:phage gp16-like protein
MMAKIHVAKKATAIDEDDYRQAIFDASGQFSLAECKDHQLVRLLDFFKSKGFRPLPKGGAKAASHPMARKARAVDLTLSPGRGP